MPDRLTEVNIMAARSILKIDKKLKRPSEPYIVRIAQSAVGDPIPSKEPFPAR